MIPPRRPRPAHYALAAGFVMLAVSLAALIWTVAALIYDSKGPEGLAVAFVGLFCISLWVRLLARIIASWD